MDSHSEHVLVHDVGFNLPAGLPLLLPRKIYFYLEKGGSEFNMVSEIPVTPHMQDTLAFSLQWQGLSFTKGRSHLVLQFAFTSMWVEFELSKCGV